MYNKVSVRNFLRSGSKVTHTMVLFLLVTKQILWEIWVYSDIRFPISDCISNVYIIERVSKILFREQFHKNDVSVTKRIQLSSFSLTTLKMADS